MIPIVSVAGTTVLLVEDEAMIAILMEDFLRELGCEDVIICGDLSGALARVAFPGFDVAVLDINLSHGETSYPIAEELQRRGVPFVFVTGYSFGDRHPPGFDDVPTVCKPYRIAQLETAMLRVLNQ